MDQDQLSKTIIDAYGKDNLLSAELVVYRTKFDQVVRDTITINFSDGDYQYDLTTKPIYSEFKDRLYAQQLHEKQETLQS